MSYVSDMRVSDYEPRATSSRFNALTSSRI